MTTPTRFGPLLRTLRKRVGMTQGDLAAAVGYSVAAISALEQERRLPVVEFVVQQIVPALALADAPQLATRLVELAATARGERPPTTITVQRAAQVVIQEELLDHPNRLPSLPTALIGRTAQVNQLCDRLLGHGGRLLTLVGPPGIGKATLALAVTAQVQPHYRNGAVFVALAAITEPTLMAATIATAVGCSDAGPKPPQTRLIEFLRRKTMLLVLDNLEQIQDAAPLVAELVAECPGVCVLATSRERLHLRAEQRFKVPPLDLAPAVEFFVQRAQAVDADFTLTPHNQATIAAICQRLDCLPLAIELSAGRIDLFSPQTMLTRLHNRVLDLLADGPDDAPAHHRTLRNAIHRSYGLCSPQEQRLFRTLGVFVGGFDLTAVIDFGFAEATLQALINKSLVNVEQRGDERRFLLLETVRQYADEQLMATNEVGLVGEQHATYFLGLAKAAVPHLGGRTEKQWLAQLTCEQANLRAALRWSIRCKPEMGQELASQLAGFWSGVGLFHEGRDWLVQVLAADLKPTLSRAQALQAAGRLAQDQNDNQQAFQCAQESLTIFETLNNPAGCASALYVMGWALAEMEQPAQALPYFERSLPLARQAGQLGLVAFACTNIANMLIRLGGRDPSILPLLQEAKRLYRQRDRPPGLAYTLRTEAMLYRVAGNDAQAALLLQEALTLVRPLGVEWEVAVTLEELAATRWHMGDSATACAYLAEALQFFQESDIKLGLINVWYDYGQIERCLQQNLDRASYYYRQSLLLCWEQNYPKLLGRALVGLAAVAQKRGNFIHAVHLLVMAEQRFAGFPPFLALAECNEYAKVGDDLRAHLGETAFARAWAEGQALAGAAAVQVALLDG